MATSHDLSRRTLLALPAILSLSAATAACAQSESEAQSGNEAQGGNRSGGAASRTLVAYFTRSGNTRVIAGTVSRALSARLFEIRPVRPYPEDYEQTVEQARQESDRGFEPPLAARIPDIAPFDTVFLGFPIWGGTAPPVIRSFLRAHNLSGKTLRSFITHGGYGLGNSVAVVADHAPRARIERPFVMEADQERRTLTQVNAWLEESELR
jgi:flavodoxin